MNNSNNPFRLNVGSMYNKSIGSIREVTLEVDQFTIDDLVSRNFFSLIRLSRTREGLLLQVEVKAEILTTCVRCLDEFYLPVETEFEELYQFPERHREDTDLVLPLDGYLDLRPVYREYLILALPIKRLCRENCAGLCIICGANINKTNCEHQHKLDPQSIMAEQNKLT